MNATLTKIRSLWRLKAVLGAVLATAIWGGYLFIERHPLFTPVAMRATWFDRAIPFTPGAVYLYESLWLLMPVAPWLMDSRRDLARYIRGLLVVILAAFVIFIVYPTTAPRPAAIHGANGLYMELISVDNELNAFPSLHAALAVFHALCCQALFSTGRRRGLAIGIVWMWSAGILASTLLTKQHVVMDIVAGTALGFAGYALFTREATAVRGASPAVQD